MSNVKIILIILINYISQIIPTNQCDFKSAIDLQSATYSHSLILRVQSINSSEEIETNLIIRKVFVRELIKISNINKYEMKINDMIIIRIDKDIDEILDDSCWHLLQITNIDIILFLNETNTNYFDLRYPPVESTFRVRQNIDSVMNYEAYSPQVIIKTQIAKPILSNSYFLQCNARGNPLPRLLWSKNNQTFEYYPSAKQCKTSCRIYSIQNKYQSVLYFQSLMNIDSGIYVCHAENALNHTMISVYINVHQTNINTTCASLKSCNNRGQCIFIDKQLKCLCDNRYFGEQCETSYDDIIKKQNNIILSFKSHFLTGCLVFLIGFIFILIIFIACLVVRNNKTRQENILTLKPIINKNINQINQQSLSSPITKKLSTTIDDKNCIATEELNMETKTNHLIHSKDYLEFYQPDAESGLIRPLNIQSDAPKHYRKCVLFHNRFLLPRTVSQ